MKANLHTHSTYCDGKNSIEEMVRAAIAKGYDILGFSSHMASPVKYDCEVEPAKYMDYVREVRTAARKYADKIHVFCGVEADFIPGVTTPDYARYADLKLDYIIGSVHYVLAPDGALVSVDNTPEILREGIKAHFNNDARAYVEAYFRQQTDMLKYDFDVVGHPDLVRKFNEKFPYFDEQADWYLKCRRDFAAELARSKKLTEVNTGGIARGWLTTPYPSPDFQTELEALGVPMIHSLDAHSAEQL